MGGDDHGLAIALTEGLACGRKATENFLLIIAVGSPVAHMPLLQEMPLIAQRRISSNLAVSQVQSYRELPVHQWLVVLY